MTPRATPKSLFSRAKLNIGMAIAGGAAAATIAGMALVPGSAHAFTYGSYDNYQDQVVQSFTLNLATALQMEYSVVAPAYYRAAAPENLPPEGVQTRDNLIDGLAGEFGLTDAEMETAFDAAWHQTMLDLEALNLDQFENWMGQLSTAGTITEAQGNQAIQWFQDGPAGVAPVNLMAAMNGHHDAAMADATALLEMDLITEDQLQAMQDWYSDRPDFLPTHEIFQPAEDPQPDLPPGVSPPDPLAG